MTEGLSIIDRLIIYKNAGIKFLRGIILKPFFKKWKGPLLIGSNVSISHANHIECGKMVKFEDFSEIQGLSTDGIKLGNYVTIGRGVMIRPSSYYGIDLGAGLVMGDHSSIGPYSYVGCSGKITIGNNVMFGPKCNLFAEQHIFSDINRTIKSQGVRQAGIIIEDDCWIGGNVTILDGVRIGKGSVIGAGCVITKNVAPGMVVIDKRQRIDKKRN